ncbi:MAG: hypothetical protein AAGI23_22800 [Bacteroidota bacterium]
MQQTKTLLPFSFLLGCFLMLPTWLLGQDFEEVQKVVASDRMTIGAEFGYKVDVSGSYAVVSVSADSQPFEKAIYVFERNENDEWIEVKKFRPDDQILESDFGHDIAISGNIIVAGDRREPRDSNGNNPREIAGAAYVYERNAQGEWQ